MSLYECLTPGTDKWVECSAAQCGRTRRINMNMDPVLRLEQYKLKLEAGQQLGELEQQDLNEIAEHIRAVIESFVNALQEAFEPIIEAISTAVKSLWDSLPEPMKIELMKEASPRLEFKLGDVATPQAGVVNAPFLQVPIMDSEARRADHYQGRGGW
ncbi:hypothetical protein SEA_HERCULESXL_55 [Microbacterium phage HerculesXL]|nr:hypothetical protein SEA_HERCULESXL_55 [Microbacterium phage HerculesXL]